VAEAFASALARKDSEDSLRASEAMKSAILSALDSGVAVLDRQGWVAAANPAWDRVASRWSPARRGLSVGANYLHAWRAAAAQGEPGAVDALGGIEAVLTGPSTGFAFEYASRAPGGERWFAVSVVALDVSEGGAVVSHTDITERKRAEIQAQQSRQELAHFTRVSAMGELTASLAHELNQPLTGILSNAQAARRFLDMAPPALHEVRQSLEEIVEDDKRAAEVIQRLRDLLRKGDSELTPLDLNVLVRDVVKLLSSDAIIRDVAIGLDLSEPSAVVRGDRVQLQQVVLNLVLNALEAMAECSRQDRRLVVHTGRLDDRTVRVSVEDVGPGFGEGTQELVFEPFYSTKPAGMGMGLAIARSIIDAHGGEISAANNPIRGATVQFSLPLDAGGRS
jgi:signal transduction histidine kinase